MGERYAVVTRSRRVSTPFRRDDTGTSVILKPWNVPSTRIEGFAEPGIEIKLHDVVVYVPAGGRNHPVARVVRKIDPSIIHGI